MLMCLPPTFVQKHGLSNIKILEAGGGEELEREVAMDTQLSMARVAKPFHIASIYPNNGMHYII